MSRGSVPLLSRLQAELGIDPAAFAVGGGSPAEGLARARTLADALRHRHPRLPGAGRLYAVGLLGRFVAGLLRRYLAERNPDALKRALSWLEERHGRERISTTFAALEELFARPAARGEEARDDPKEPSSAAEEPEAALEDLILLWTLNGNPALRDWRELFDDRELEARTSYRELVEGLQVFFEGELGYGPDDLSVFELLQAPARAAPDSVEGQLRFLVNVTTAGEGPSAGQAPDEGLLVGLDVIREEDKPVFAGPGGPPGPPPGEVLDLSGLAEDGEERFTADRAWMPRLVLMAKNTFVWLDQLSRSYGRPIRRLDEIPGRELDRLARWGFTGLWLIGLWQRSAASKDIKRRCGNDSAEASAYAIDSYRIADELGGEAALEELQGQARRRGLRIACDMVPNHMGIDSAWVLEHPERFLSLPESPFPNYRFSGPDLSPRPEEVGLFLEDHYYDRSDAAVVFLRLDRRTGEKRYVYHGNDGTSLPWNDTAQLDYLRAETREAVIRTILEVARRFPVIRFDAAMTLARRHVQRLWYPEPGTGGDIPSRAGRGISREDLERLMPEEFWREVVDRVAREAPDTLLLAEAFWLMEGYFVRSLGMHRVYNSAFMNLLREENNAGFRTSIKNVLEFRPEILGRFVNYATNPDEGTAAGQFGTGEKYFGVCTLMATLPGLPLFGHGQMEGFREKYGMEYRRALLEEVPDAALVERHEELVVPLLRRRRLFAGSTEFRLFDFERADGSVDENVIAFSNRHRSTAGGEERALVVFHNGPGRTAGRLRWSVPFRVSGAGEDERLDRETLVQALGLGEGDAWQCRDRVTGEERYLTAEALIQDGLFLELGPYEHAVLESLPQTAAERPGTEPLGDAPPVEAPAPAALAVEEVLAAEPLEALLRVAEEEDPARALETAIKAWRGSAEEGYSRLRTILAEQGPGASRELRSGPPSPKLLALRASRWLAAALALLTPEVTAAGRNEVGDGDASDGEASDGKPEDRKPKGREAEGREAEDSKAKDRGANDREGYGKEAIDAEAGGHERGAADAAGALFRQLHRSFRAAAVPPSTRLPVTADALSLGLIFWAAMRPLGRFLGTVDTARRTLSLLEGRRLGATVRRRARRLGLGADAAEQVWAGLRLGTVLELWYLEAPAIPGELLETWLAAEEVRRFLGIHEQGGVEWFNREGYRAFLCWLLAIAWVDHGASGGTLPDAETLARSCALVEELHRAEEPSAYRLTSLREKLGLRRASGPGEGSEPRPNPAGKGGTVAKKAFEEPPREGPEGRP